MTLAFFRARTVSAVSDDGVQGPMITTVLTMITFSGVTRRREGYLAATRSQMSSILVIEFMMRPILAVWQSIHGLAKIYKEQTKAIRFYVYTKGDSFNPYIEDGDRDDYNRDDGARCIGFFDDFEDNSEVRSDNLSNDEGAITTYYPDANNNPLLGRSNPLVPSENCDTTDLMARQKLPALMWAQTMVLVVRIGRIAIYMHGIRILNMHSRGFAMALGMLQILSRVMGLFALRSTGKLMRILNHECTSTVLSFGPEIMKRRGYL